MLLHLVNVLFPGEFLWFNLQYGQNWETEVWINHTVLSREIQVIHCLMIVTNCFSFQTSPVSEYMYLQFPSYLIPIRFIMILAQYAVWLTHLFFIPFGLQNSKLLIISCFVYIVLCIDNVFISLPCVSSTMRTFTIGFHFLQPSLFLWIFSCAWLLPF